MYDDDTIKILRVNKDDVHTVDVSISDIAGSLSLIDLTKVILTWLGGKAGTLEKGIQVGALLVWQQRTTQDLARDFFLGILYGMSKYAVDAGKQPFAKDEKAF